MYRISKEFHFSASHVLGGLAPGHPCGRMHGHNYIVRIYLVAEDLDETGFVADFGDLAPFKAYIAQNLDHRHLNDVLGDGVQPSAEVLAEFLYRRACYLFLGAFIEAVRVWETPKAWAEYRP